MTKSYQYIYNGPCHKCHTGKLLSCPFGINKNMVMVWIQVCSNCDYEIKIGDV